MNISALCIRRPVMTVLVMLCILVFGVMSYQKLPIDNLPNVDYPVIVVTASLAGANPETIASTVATPLEKQFAKIAGLTSMVSQSQDNYTTITLSFSFKRNIDLVAQDVNTAIALAKEDLPNTMTTPPSYTKTNPSAQPILYYFLTSKTLSLSKLQDYAESYIVNNLSTVDGVSEVKIMGTQKPAVRIQLDPQKLSSMGISTTDVQLAITDGNVNNPSGSMSNAVNTFTFNVKGQMMQAKEYNELIVMYKNGLPVRIKDVGKAVDSVETEKIKLWFMTKENEYEGIVLAVNKQPGSNAVAIADAIKAKIPEIQSVIPQGILVYPLYDASLFIKESMWDVQFTLILTIFLVVIVIFVFLRDIRSTVIPGIAVPLSLIGTFAVMHLLDYSLNSLSMMALVLSVGFVVDDAIVMMENIVRRVELGEDVETASFKGAKEIYATIVSMTISLVVVFIPILFMGGILGKLFSEFAVSIAVAILLSGFISITLTPMMCSKILRSNHKKHGKIYMVIEKSFDGARDAYEKALIWVLRHKRLMLFVTFLSFVFSGVLIWFIDKGFIPSQDSNYYLISTRANESVSYKYMFRHQEEINKIVCAEENTKAIFSIAGYPNENGGFLFVALPEKEKRKLTVDEIMAKLRGPINSVPGIQAFSFNPPPIQLDARGAIAEGMITLSSANLNDLQETTKIMQERMKTIPGVTDVSSDMQLKRPQVAVEIDRDKASALGLSVGAIQDVFYANFAVKQVSTIYGSTNSYKVFIEIDPYFQNDPDIFSKIYIKNDQVMVPLSTVAKKTETVAALSVNHTNQIPSATISYNLLPGYAVNKVMASITDEAKQVVPSSVNYKFEGSGGSFESTFKDLTILFFITVFIIYVVLGILYESYIHPVTILTSLPLAFFGALFFLWLFNLPLDIYGFIGIIMLVGLVKKNGIMMVDFALVIEEKEKVAAEVSIVKACITRFRPIMMTTMAAIFGTLPIAIGYGAGGDARQPMGIAVVGGLVFSQMLTLFVTPVFYVYMDKINKLLKNKKHNHKKSFLKKAVDDGENTL